MMRKDELLPSAAELVLSESAEFFEPGEKTHKVCAALGLGLDPWQLGAVRAIEARRRDGKYAARTVCLSVPRQVGKTFLVGAIVFARCLAQPGLTAVWTAHRFGVARETFDALNALAESPKVAPYVAHITTAAGNEVIRFNNGSRIVFKARERAAIRGFSKVGLLVLDEAQILTDAALGDMLPTTNQHPDPQIIMLGTPPRPNDPGEAFTRARDRALAGDATGLTFIQFSGEDIADANPSYPHRTGPEAIQAMELALSPEDFRREALGIWDADGDTWVIPREAWEAAADEAAEMDPSRRPVFAVDISPSRSSGAVAVAYWLRDGRRRRVEVVKHEYGTDWVVPWLASAERPEYLAVALDVGGPAGSLVPALLSARVRPLKRCNAADAKAAAGGFFDGVMNGAIAHLGDEVLTNALAGAEKRTLLDAWAWSRKDSEADITPLVAATLAAYALEKRRETQSNGMVMPL